MDATRPAGNLDELIRRVAEDLAAARHAIALTGAGISTESGIPDFRGPSGVWTKDPGAERRAYLSYERFVADPRAWWQERLRAPAVLGNIEGAVPNGGHLALAELERAGLLRRVITQNVDGLHEKAGSTRVIEYHGSLLKLRCVKCGTRYSKREFDLDALDLAGMLPPFCPHCGGVVKTDTVAFGEPIPADVSRESLIEARRCDIMLICGTSAVVYPFADLPRVAKQRVASVTIVEINAEATLLTHAGISDYLIQGQTGEVLPRIVNQVRALIGEGGERP